MNQDGTLSWASPGGDGGIRQSREEWRKNVVADVPSVVPSLRPQGSKEGLGLEACGRIQDLREPLP